jgi:hypothetical protein
LGTTFPLAKQSGNGLDAVFLLYPMIACFTITIAGFNQMEDAVGRWRDEG